MAYDDLAAAISSHISTSQEYADEAMLQVNTLTETLQSLVDDLRKKGDVGFFVPNRPSWEGLSAIDPADKPAGLDLSEANGLIDSGAAPPSYTPGEISFGSPVAIAEFSRKAPDISLPQAPSGALPDAPASPDVSLPDIPAPPDYVLPELPTFEAFTLPDAPDFTPVGPFTKTVPAFSIEAPGSVLNYNERTYVSELQDLASAWLRRQIEDGGTGLAPEVEQAIWDRGMVREVTAVRRNLESAADEFAAAGYPMPPGALRARMSALRADLQNRAEDLSRTIMTEQAQLAQRNTQFAVEKALQLEALTLQHFNNVAERALRFAQASAELAIAVFNARVAEYNTRLEGFRTEAQIHESNVRAALQELENYRTLLQAKQIEGSLRQQDIDLYIGQIRGVEALFGLHRTQLEASKVEADIERLKIEIYRGEIDGYTAQIGAKTAEFGLYRARIEGEKAKLEAFEAEVQAYQALVAGKTAQIGAQRSQVEAQVEVEKGKIEQAKIQLSLYLAEIERNKAAIQTIIQKFAAQNDAYRTEISRAEAEARVRIAGASIDAQYITALSSEINARYRKEAELLVALANAGISGTQAAADLQARIASAALSQINTISQIAATAATSE